ncbi:MAG: heme A synthase, partial [Hymenobacter sp.]
TIHMGLALLIVAMLLYAADRAQREPTQAIWTESPAIANGGPTANGLQTLLWLLLLATFIQIVLGTQVREQIDHIAAAADYAGRTNWVSQLGSVFKVHRSMSILVTLLNGYAAYQLWPLAGARLRRLVAATLAVLGLEIGAGITLAYLALPAWVQPVHLTLATLLFGAQFLTLVAWHRAQAVIKQGQLRPAHA